MKKFFGIILALTLGLMSAWADDLRFVQVDDTFYNPNSDVLDRVIKSINNQKDISFVVFSGNNISKPDKTYLESFLKSAKKLNSPYYIIIGNKDVNKQKDLSKVQYMKLVSKHNRAHKRIHKPNYVFEKQGVVFIVVDGSKDVIPSSMGYFKADTLTWLEEQLNKYKGRNVILLQHFPIIPPSDKETHYTFKPEEYMAVLSKHSNVLAVISGHFGVNKEQTVMGKTHISTASAPQYKIIDILNCDTKNPTIWTTVMSGN